MTYKELKTEIDKLTPEELEQDALIATEGKEALKVIGLWITEEDQVNSTGDCWEDISTCQDDDEPIVCKKGKIFLNIEYIPYSNLDLIK